MNIIEHKWVELEKGKELSKGDYCYGLTQIAQHQSKYDKANVALLVAIIVQAGRDRDLEFFESALFIDMCKVCALDSTFVINIIKQIWEYYE